MNTILMLQKLEPFIKYPIYENVLSTRISKIGIKGQGFPEMWDFWGGEWGGFECPVLATE